MRPSAALVAALALALVAGGVVPAPAQVLASARSLPTDYGALVAEARAYVDRLPSPTGSRAPDPALRWDFDRQRQRITIATGGGTTVEATAALIGIWSPDLGEFFLADRASSYPPEMTAPARAVRAHAEAHAIAALADHHPVTDIAAAADRAAIGAYLSEAEAVFRGSGEGGLVFFLTLSEISGGARQ